MFFFIYWPMFRFQIFIRVWNLGSVCLNNFSESYLLGFDLIYLLTAINPETQLRFFSKSSTNGSQWVSELRGFGSKFNYSWECCETGTGFGKNRNFFSLRNRSRNAVRFRNRVRIRIQHKMEYKVKNSKLRGKRFGKQCCF
jgi:hypothetical protein